MGVWTSTPHDATAGAVLTAAQWDATVRDGFNAFGAMTSYTPSWTASTTNPVLGNGTLEGWYTQIQKTVFYRIRLTCGSTTTYGSGTYRFSPPVTAVSQFTGAGESCGVGLMYDSSAPLRYARTAYLATTTTISLISDDGTLVNPTSPFTFANGDTLSITGWFEAA